MNLLNVIWSGVFSPNSQISRANWRFLSLLQSLRTDGIASKRINIKAKSMERTGKRLLPLPVLAYSASIRLTVKFISILENNNLRVSQGSPRNRFKPRYHLHSRLFHLSLDTLTPINITKPKTGFP